MVNSVSRWMRGVQVKLWDPLRTRAIPERLRDAFTTRRYINPRLPYKQSNTFSLQWIAVNSVCYVVAVNSVCCVVAVNSVCFVVIFVTKLVVAIIIVLIVVESCMTIYFIQAFMMSRLALSWLIDWLIDEEKISSAVGFQVS